MTIYMIYEGELNIGFDSTETKTEKVVSCKLKESDAYEYLSKWATQIDREINILDWSRQSLRSYSLTGEGFIGAEIRYSTYNQERWCRYAIEEHKEASA